MIQPIPDPDVQLLAAIAANLQSDYIAKNKVDPWQGSPFAWIRTRKSRQVGKIGEQLVAGWCAAKGLDVVRSPDSEADRLIAGFRIEVKFSTLWESGVYKFQQIRDQKYQFGILLGLSPFMANCWVVPKDKLWNNSIPQHGGKIGTDTHWLSFPANNPPVWLNEFGGTLAEAHQVLLHLQ